MAISFSTSTLGSGTVSRISRDSTLLKQQMEVLARQSADGRKAIVYGDLAPDARRAIDLRADTGRREAYSAAVDRTLGRTGAAQNALERLSAIATDFMQSAFEINGTESSRISAVASSARSALAEVASLLNEKQAGEYVFSGSDSANPPIPNPDGIADSQMVTDIIASVQGLTDSNAAGIMADTLASAQSSAPGVTPFSDFLEDPARGGGEAPRSTPVGDGEVVGYGVFANRNVAAVSTGETTGSWSRDLIRGLSMLAGLTPDSAQQGQGFTDVMSGIRAIFSSATDALGVEAGAMGSAEARITAAKQSHGDMIVALQTQVSDIEDVDLAQTLTNLQDVQTRLQASYRAISIIGGLNLSDYIK